MGGVEVEKRKGRRCYSITISRNRKIIKKKVAREGFETLKFCLWLQHSYKCYLYGYVQISIL